MTALVVIGVIYAAGLLLSLLLTFSRALIVVGAKRRRHRRAAETLAACRRLRELGRYTRSRADRW
jgi:hypothetical protein